MSGTDTPQPGCDTCDSATSQDTFSPPPGGEGGTSAFGGHGRD